jgi:hypothetical protein
MADYTFQSQLWLYEGKGSWHFVTLPRSLSAQIKAASVASSAFGSIRVVAMIGGSRWKTSLFPDSKAGAYLLPVKAAVRGKEKLRAGDTVEVTLLMEKG